MGNISRGNKLDLGTNIFSSLKSLNITIICVSIVLIILIFIFFFYLWMTPNTLPDQISIPKYKAFDYKNKNNDDYYNSSDFKNINKDDYNNRSGFEDEYEDEDEDEEYNNFNNCADFKIMALTNQPQQTNNDY